MSMNVPLVTIGIPTYNRAELLRRSIESALRQDYAVIEVIISDNASTDNTKNVCQDYYRKDNRIKYTRQACNIGSVANFAFVLQEARGEYFMWLGDDDWVDPSYVSRCVSILVSDSDVALVSGVPIYYRNGVYAYNGNLFDLLESSWLLRVFNYYGKVADNGMFYGVMRTSHLQKVTTPNVMGGDWHLMANMAALGKTMMSPEVAVHRELGGATSSYRNIAKSLGLPSIQGMFPMITVGLSAVHTILFSGVGFERRSIFTRGILAVIVFFIVIAKPVYFSFRKLLV